MTRLPLDAIPQHRLVDELRVAIDASGRTPSLRLLELIDANPRSIWSTHVLYNIGRRRVSTLVAACRARGRALPSRYDGDSSRSSARIVARWLAEK